MYYAEPIYRPPSERDSLLLQVTVGCSRPHCTFCFFSQQQARFRVRKQAEIFADIDEAADVFGTTVESLFIMAADPSVIGPARLSAIAEYAHRHLPNLKRIALYAYAIDLLHQTDASLAAMRISGIEKLFIGVESGSDAVLRAVKKGATADEIAEGCLKAIANGFTVSVHIILGLGGRTLSNEHARMTAALLSRVSPHYVGFLTLVMYPDTALGAAERNGSFQQLTPDEALAELHAIITEITPKDRPIRVTANCYSNHFDLGGVLPAQRATMLEALNAARWTDTRSRPDIARVL